MTERQLKKCIECDTHTISLVCKLTASIVLHPCNPQVSLYYCALLTFPSLDCLTDALASVSQPKPYISPRVNLHHEQSSRRSTKHVRAQAEAAFGT